MTTLKRLFEQITEELNDSCCYIKWALNTRDEDNALSKLLYQLSDEELDHANRLNDIAKRMIADEEEASESMQMFFDYVREQHLKKIKEIKMCQSIYKEN